MAHLQLGRTSTANSFSITRKDANGGQLAQTAFGYDPHRRQITLTDARTGTSTNTFDNADRIKTVATPAPASGQASQVTTTYYNNMGWITNVVLPDGGSVKSSYWLTGELATNSGVRTYPAGYTYDYAGRVKTLTTWTDFASFAGPAATTWYYDAYRGFMTNKAYADGKGPGYTYTPAGRLKTRVWARGVATTYSFDNFGDLSTTVYSDSTPNVTNSFDRLGRPITINRGTNVTTLVYNIGGQLLSETFNGITVTNIHDSLLRRVTNGVVSGATWLTMSTNSYDAASRVLLVSDRTNSATYSYLTNSPLVSQIVFQQSGTTRMTTTKKYDNLNRLLAISNAPSADSVVSFNYAYNSANQRTSVTNSDGTRWVYQYDSLGQVISGKKYWSDGIPVAGQQFEYGYDDIGNRKFAGSGGDQWGTNLRYEQYTANSLNQYTQRTVPGAVDILGAANSNATVTVNNRPSYRKWEYFRNDYRVSNVGAPVYASLTNLAVLANGTNADVIATNVGHTLVAATPETLTYDLDGNRTSDSLWTNAWNAENRLIAVESALGVPAAAKQKVEFAYDYKGMRIQRVVYSWNGSAYVVQRTTKSLYDSAELLAEVNETNGLTGSFMSGLDITSSEQGASGVGSMLGMNDSVNGSHFYGVDGNGNVAQLVKASTGAISASYEYSPFGITIRATGPEATENRISYSSKYHDSYTGSYDFGLRDYEPHSGCWLSRDSYGELGDKNLYGFTVNNPIIGIDIRGLYTLKWGQGMTGNNADRQKTVTDLVGGVGKALPDLRKAIQDEFKNSNTLPTTCECEKYGKYLHAIDKVFGQVQDGIKGNDNLTYLSKAIDVGRHAETKNWKTTLQDKGILRFWDDDASDQKSTLFHEMTHLYGTDDESKQLENDAEFLERIFYQGFTGVLKIQLKLQAKAQCK